MTDVKWLWYPDQEEEAQSIAPPLGTAMSGMTRVQLALTPISETDLPGKRWGFTNKTKRPY